jgi:lipopolysaccharide/colanic/teichoic acid biosynthesis glycosyltransferase
MGDAPRLKSIFDRAVAGGLIVLSSPVIAATTFVMAIDMAACPRDRGSFLYRERRVTGGEEFDLLKFRTLRIDVLAEMAAVGGHARTYEARADNLTWAGRRLLKPWYLDELPQLLNILRGEMSLVGPRPWPLSMVAAQVARGERYREHVRAGWTGPAQVQKGARDPVSYAALDLQYVSACRTWGALRLLRYDVRILMETARVLLRGEGLKY